MVADKMVYGQNGIWTNCHWSKWYGQKWYGQNGTDKASFHVYFFNGEVFDQSIVC